MKKIKDSKFFNSLIDDTNKSLELLVSAISISRTKNIDEKERLLFYDGAIKRFENLFTKTTNLLRFALAQEGIETISPRQVIQESSRVNWINDIDFWKIALDTRSSTINKISDLTYGEYLNIITQFASETEVVLNLLASLRAD